MRFTETGVTGVYVIEPVPIVDERGFFARTFCAEEFAENGIEPPVFLQANTSLNHHRGTLRGIHYEAPPHAPAKLVRCTLGSIYDVAVDLRPESPTFRRWTATELNADNRLLVYVPVGVAHGFLTLSDGAEVFYQMTALYNPHASRGVRWDDPAFGIEWPFDPEIMSRRDRTYPDFDPEELD